MVVTTYVSICPGWTAATIIPDDFFPFGPYTAFNCLVCRIFASFECPYLTIADSDSKFGSSSRIASFNVNLSWPSDVTFTIRAVPGCDKAVDSSSGRR